MSDSTDRALILMVRKMDNLERAIRDVAKAVRESQVKDEVDMGKPGLTWMSDCICGHPFTDHYPVNPQVCSFFSVSMSNQFSCERYSI